MMGSFVRELLLCLFSPTGHERCLEALLALALIFSVIVSGINIRVVFLYPGNSINRPVSISR